MDVGLLIIRLVVGLTLAAHGAQKLFGAFGGKGISGTGAFLESLGFRPGRRQAEIAGFAELVGGLMFAVGVLTPFASAAIIGVMLVASVAANGRAFFITAGGYEYTMVLGAVAAGIAFTGPGFVSVDRLLDLDLRGIGWGALGVALGVSAGLAQLSTRNRDGDDDLVDLREGTETPLLTKLSERIKR